MNTLADEQARVLQKAAYIREYEDNGIALVSYHVKSPEKSNERFTGSGLPKDVDVVFGKGNLVHAVQVPQIEIHADSEVYQPGTEGKLVVHRDFAVENNWWLEVLDEDSTPESGDDNEASSDYY